MNCVRGKKQRPKLFISTPERPACAPQKLQDAPQTSPWEQKADLPIRSLNKFQTAQISKIIFMGQSTVQI